MIVEILSDILLRTEIRKDCKPFIGKCGGLESLITIGILVNEDFNHYTLALDLTVSEFIRFHNTYDNHCVLSIETPEGSHVIYVHNNTIYDTQEVENRGQYYDYKVKEFLMKESD